MRITKSYWVSTTSFRAISEKFEVPFEKLSPVLEEYIQTSQYEVFSLRMDKLFGKYSPFAKQEIIAEVNECIEELHCIENDDCSDENRKSVKLIKNRALVYVKDI